jgi:WD40 repeat protein
VTTRLPRDVVTQHLARLRPALTRPQAAQVEWVLEVLGDDGRFLLRDAFDALELTYDAFRDFLERINAAATTAGVDLALVLDSREAPPSERYGWFRGSDLVDEGIASFAGEAAARTGIDHPITAEVAELHATPRIRIYASFHPATGETAKRADALLERLRTELAATADDREWAIADPRSVPLGEDTDSTRDRLSAQADVRLVLLTSAYLATSGLERRRALEAPGRVVAAALSDLPEGPIPLGPLHRDDIVRAREPWDGLRSTSQRANYVGDIAKALRRALRLSRPAADRSPDDWLGAHSARLAERDITAVLVEDQQGAETSLRESQLDGASTGPAMPAVGRLVAWATDTRPGAPRLCALLGDVGMGKTTTAKLFTRQLLTLRTQGERVPLPILFDLRDVRVATLGTAMTLDALLDAMLDATRPPDVPAERLCAQVVRARLAQGDAVVVFDGLDEVLVHLAPHDRQLFTRQLWRATEGQAEARMLLTCRTQYFRTIRDEATYFTGESRQGLRGGDYLALLMLPFRDDQVREYLAANLGRGDVWVDGFLATIAAVHDLPDLARRPLTLRLVADQVEFIETAKLEGRTLRAVDLYAEVVDRWLARDTGKHTLTPGHKHLLMEEIAAALWRSGKNSWTATEVDDWLLALLARRPDLELHYGTRMPDLWKADFRTATFLKRDGDTLTFGHRSLFEYFLARFLHRALADGASEALAMPVPSPEVLDFLGQLIAGDGKAALAGLTRIGRQYTSQVSELAFAYALQAAERGHPHQSLAGVCLAGAHLAEWTIGFPDCDGLLSLAGADLSATDLRWAVFHRVDLSATNLARADLTLAELHDSLLRLVQTDGARVVGTVFRKCLLDDTDLSRATTYRTQILRCTAGPEPAGGLLLAPIATDRAAGAPRPLTGHRKAVNAVAWSPDGTRLATAGTDGTAQLWDPITGEQLITLTDTATMSAVAWSPDGTRIATAGEGGTRLWDPTGQQLTTLSDSGPVNAVAWSPDGTRLATADIDGTARLWELSTGQQLPSPIGHTSPMRALAWSPDGARIATASIGGTTRVWNPATGQQLATLIGIGPVNAVAWSPDGTRIATAGTDGTARLWNPTTGDQLTTIPDIDRVHAVAWSPDGTRIATAGVGGTTRVWNSTTGQQLTTLTAHTTSVQAVAWSPDSTRIATTSSDGTTRVWNPTTGEQLTSLTGHTTSVQAVAWSPDGTRIATTSIGGSTRVWNSTTGQQLTTLTGHTRLVTDVDWSPDATYVVTASDDGTTRLWNPTTGENLATLACHTDPLDAVAWSPDGTCIATASFDGSTRLWNPTTGQQLTTLTGHTRLVTDVAWSPDAIRIATASHDGTTRLWNPTTGQQLTTLTHRTGWVNAIAWSPDATRLATAGEDGTTTVWNPTIGEHLDTLTGHTGPVRAVAWSPDATRIATAGDDGTTRLWNPTTGQQIGIRVTALPYDEVAVYDATTDDLVGASDGAWRWLGYAVVQDGQLARLPAETFGPLPPLTRR